MISSKQILFLLFFLCLNFKAAAQDNMAQLDSYLDEELLTDLEASSFQTVDKLHEQQKQNKDDFKPLDPIRPKSAPLFKPEEFRAVLKKGSFIEDIETGRNYKTQREIIVIAKEKIVGGSKAFILNQQKKALYSVDTKDLVSIQEDLNLTPQENFAIDYSGKVSKHSLDKQLPLVNFLSWHVDKVDASALTHFYNQDGSGSAKATRLDNTLVYKSFLPFFLGFSLNYQVGEWTNESNTSSIRWKSFSLGPALVYPLFQNETFSLDTLLKLQKSLFFNTTSDFEAQASFSSYGAEAALLGELKTSWGGWFVGGNYRHERLALSSSNIEGTTIDPQKKTFSSLGIFLGIKLGFQL